MFDSIIFIFRTVNITFGKTICKHNKIDKRCFNIRKVTVGRLEQFIKKLPERLLLFLFLILNNTFLYFLFIHGQIENIMILFFLYFRIHDQGIST